MIFIDLSDRNFVTEADDILKEFRKLPKTIWFLPSEFLQNGSGFFANKVSPNFFYFHDNMIVLKYLEANKKNTTTSKIITPNCVPICFGTLGPATMLHFPYISEPFMKLTATKVAAECILYILSKSPVWVKLYDPWIL